MAFNNLLNGSFRGAVGTMVGEKWKNKKTVHTRVFSKSPPTEKQTKNVRAFECLNRLASAMANKFYPWLGLTNKEMYPHNAVARWLKPLIADHSFNPEVIQDIIEEDGLATIDEFKYDRMTQKFECKASTAIDPREGSNESWLLVVLDSEGRVWYCESPKTKIVEFERDIAISRYQSLCAFTMVSRKVDGKFKLSGLYYDELPPQYDIHLDIENVTLDDANSRVIISGQAQEYTIDFEATLVVRGVGVSSLRNVDYTAETTFTIDAGGKFTQVLQIPKDEYGDRYYFRKGNQNVVEETQIVKGKFVITIKRYSFNIRDINKTYTFKGSLPDFTRGERTFTLSNTGWFADGLGQPCSVLYTNIEESGRAIQTYKGVTCATESQGVRLEFEVSEDCRGDGNFFTAEDSKLVLAVDGEDGKGLWRMETSEKRFSFSYWDNPLTINLKGSNMSTSKLTSSSVRRWYPDVYKGTMYWLKVPSASCSFMSETWSKSGSYIVRNISFDAEESGLYVYSGGGPNPTHDALSNVRFAPIHATGYVNAVASNGVTVRLRYAVGSSAVTWTRT